MATTELICLDPFSLFL